MVPGSIPGGRICFYTAEPVFVSALRAKAADTANNKVLVLFE